MDSRNISAPEVKAGTTPYEAGFRAYMVRIYTYMTGALALTGIVALLFSQSAGFLNAMYTIENDAIVGMRPLGWAVMLAPLGMVVFLSVGIERLGLIAAQMSFWVYAALVGFSLSSIFILFTGESIARVFFITAATFAGMSLYGYTTSRNLTGLGSFLFMGLVGIIIAGLVNLFLKSSGVQFVTSILGVLIFAGLTAFDTQRLKMLYSRSGAFSIGQAGKLAILGALALYLDFINIFLSLLNIFGERRS
jgi:hypothetical protein